MPISERASAAASRLQIVINPSSGSRNASTFLLQTIEPFLRHLDTPFDARETLSEGDGERLGRLLREEMGEETETAVVAVLGGDGTAHELITGFNSVSFSSESNSSLSRAPSLQLIPLPFGTANALYNSLHPPSSLDSLQSHPYFQDRFLSQTDLWALQSLFTYVSDRRSPSNDSHPCQHLLPLPLTQTTFQSLEHNCAETFTSHIVTSFALHANLLDLSESLRASHPGIERFKLAADTLASVQFSGALRLHPTSLSSSSPSSSSCPKLYNPVTRSFEPIASPSGLDIVGPFSYILASTTVSRIEPTFVIAPLLEKESGNEPEDAAETMDLIVFRPGRSKSVRDDLVLEEEGKGKGAWKSKVWEVLGRAYKEGSHVDMVLEDAVEPGLGGNGEVECYRVSGFDWIPDLSDERAHVVCADGQIHRVPKGGSARSRVLKTSSSNASLWVWK